MFFINFVSKVGQVLEKIHAQYVELKFDCLIKKRDLQKKYLVGFFL